MWYILLGYFGTRIGGREVRDIKKSLDVSAWRCYTQGKSLDITVEYGVEGDSGLLKI
jgi:hypothetical protein